MLDKFERDLASGSLPGVSSLASTMHSSLASSYDSLGPLDLRSTIKRMCALPSMQPGAPGWMAPH